MKTKQATNSVARWFGQLLLMLLLSLALSFVWGADQANPTIRQRQTAQQQARATATELVANILDTQLRQFKENKLDKLPAYADIEAMRRNLDRLVQGEMQSVVELLAQAEQSKEPERQTALTQARTKGREVVVALLAEQQKLRQRMRLAKIAVQARQLIELETHILVDTRELPEKPQAEREQTTLERLEDQRDIVVLHEQLVSTLREVQNWEGSTGTAAKKGLDLLTTASVDQELKNAIEGLNSNRFADAQKAEEAAIRGWNALLEVIEEAQGLNHPNIDAAMKAVEELLQKQAQLREETASSQLDDPMQSEQLAQQQHTVQNQLEQLNESLPPNPTAQEMAKQASESAKEAETSIFEAKKDEALQQQQEVIDKLAEVAKQLEQDAQQSAKAQSDSLAEQSQSQEKSSQPSDQAGDKKADPTGKGKSVPAEKGKQLAEKSSRQQPGDAQQQTDQKSGIPNPGNKASPMHDPSDRANESPQQSLKSEPWFVKLPPDVQKSIQARARRPAPRGYEERLKRYFESD